MIIATIPDTVLTDLRMTLEAIPEDFQALQGSLNIIFDTGCSYVVTGFKDDFKAGHCNY